MKKSLFTLLFLVIATAVPALAAPAASPTLDCWARALGGREKLSAIRSLERSGTIEMGSVKGRFHSWHTAAGAFRTDVELGPYRSTDVFDGAHGWTRTGSAPAHDLAEGDLARVTAEGYLESLSMFFADRMKGEVAMVASQPAPVLELRPHGGQPVTVTLDPASCLPVSMEQPDRDRKVRADVLAWTEVDGMRFPEKIRQGSGDPKYDVVITCESIVVNSEIPAGLFASSSDGETGIAWSGRSSVAAAIELTQNHVYIPVLVNGKGPSMFMLDTGADLTVIDKQRAADLGLPTEGSMEVRGAGESSQSAGMISAPTLGVAGLEIPSEAMMTFPLGALGLYEGRPIDGILGYDVLSRFVIEIDYAAKKVVFFDPAKFTAPADARAFDIRFDGNSPVMNGSIALPDGRSFDVRLSLDTGNRTALILNQPFVEAHAIRKSLPVLANAPLGMGVGGMTRQDLGRVASLTIGGFEIKTPLTSFTIEKAGANANPELDGNLGGEVLRRFTLWIDYGKKRILLRPNANLAEPFEYDMSGMLLGYGDASQKQPVVRNVLPGSPAEASGVRVNDVVVAVDGAETVSMKLEDIRAALRIPGRTVRLKVRRGAADQKITLKTKRLI